MNRYFIEYLLHERTHISDFYSSLFKILKKQTGLIPVGLIKDDKSYVLSSILPTRYNKEETNTITNKYYEENAIVHLVGRWIM